MLYTVDSNDSQCATCDTDDTNGEMLILAYASTAVYFNDTKVLLTHAHLWMRKLFDVHKHFGVRKQFGVRKHFSADVSTFAQMHVMCIQGCI